MGVTISLCMIVRDEEEALARCLNSAALAADELILVDTGSVDRTREIARRYTDKVYSFPWEDDFAAARNFSFSKATMDYCMWLDADDVLEPEDQRALLRLKAELDPKTDVVMLPYYTAVQEDGTPTFWYYRERIVRNAPGWRWQGRVHEAIVPTGRIFYGKAAVTHRKGKPADPDRNLRILEKMKAGPEGLSPREQFYYGRELYAHGRYAQAIRVLETFWEEPEGWLENKLNACGILAECYRALGRDDQGLLALLKSLLLDAPRAELCCQLGELFMEKNQYRLAAYWYETARSRPFQPDSGAFVQPDCYGYLPCIQLCVCYDRLGDYRRAEAYNELAGNYRPDAQAYRMNRDYFRRIRQKENEKGERSNELS